MQPDKPESSSNTKKWLIGCGIGCGALIIIAALLIVGGVLFVKDIVKGFEESEALSDTLVERYGEIREYCPAPNGIIKAERIEAFIEVRELTSEIRSKLEADMSFLADKEEEEKEDKKSRSVITKIRTGLGLVPQLAGFMKARNQALLDVEMGLGEYYYIYTTAYYFWLEKPIEDGLPIQFSDNDEGFSIKDWDDDESREVRRDLLLRRLNRLILPMLQNQYDKLATEPTGTDEVWESVLKTEIEALEANRYRTPWQDGLPDFISSSLEPYRTRLEVQYSSILNNLEISLE